MTSRILVCDDEPHITRAISLKLQRAGYDMQTATDCDSGWERVQEFRPDLLITDYQMPGGTGVDLVGRIRSLDGFDSLPVILLTAKGFELADEADRMAELHIEHVMAKPFSPRELAHLVSTLLATAGSSC
uniref:Response regulator n=1 Tax=Schlesneria paludicola TaxID=360056 RepID=A0A7C2K0Z0_9PLAN